MGELLQALVGDLELRGARSLPQARAHLGFPAKVGDAPRSVLAAFGAWKASELTADAIDAYVERRLADGARHATVNRGTQLLGQALRLGVRRGKLVSIPEIRRLREDNARQGFFEVGEYEIIMANLPVYLQDVARFAFLTGWRRGEILSLTWADVDRDGGVVRLRPEHSKNRQGRTLAIEGDLKPLIDRRRQARVVTRSDQTTGVADLVFHRDGRPIVDFRKAWARACAGAGIAPGRAGRTFHDFRRTAVRNLVRAGVPERVAMSVSGHKTRAVFDRYNIVSEADLRAAMQRQTAYVNALPKTATVTSLGPR